MLIALSKEAKESQINLIIDKLGHYNLTADIYKIDQQPIITIRNECSLSDVASLEAMDFVEKIIPISKPYKLVSREYKKENSLIRVANNIEIGQGGQIHVFAGPCAVENEEQIILTAQAVKKAGASVLRGGAYKPRTSPYSFQGLEEEGLKLLKKAGKIADLPIITEVMDINHIDVVAKYADILQVGSRNMQNYSLLKELSCLDKPVMLKRGISATIEEWLLAAEYIMAGGNSKIILCERGIRTFEVYTRNTLDLAAVPLIKELSHLPIIVDPSHGTGKWKLVKPMAKAAIAAGADGIMVEVHPVPSQALSDGEQSLNFNNFNVLMQEIAKIKGRLR